VRPRYATEQDRVNEANALRSTIDYLNAKAPSGDVYTGLLATAGAAFDFFVGLNGQRVAIVEYKRRKGPSERYAHWHISKGKLKECGHLADIYSVQFFLLFEWDDGLFICDMESFGDTHETFGGRTDRGDACDQEVLVNIPRANFTKISG
jgi:hypothetical protein